MDPESTIESSAPVPPVAPPPTPMPDASALQSPLESPVRLDNGPLVPPSPPPSPVIPRAASPQYLNMRLQQLEQDVANLRSLIRPFSPRLPVSVFWAKVQGSVTGGWAWQEMIHANASTLTLNPSPIARSGTLGASPAVEVNGLTQVVTGQIVLMAESSDIGGFKYDFAMSIPAVNTCA